MKNKKGFTLVELLAVIAILSLLVIIALPNIVAMFKDAKRYSFITECRQIFKAAQNQWMNDSMFEVNEIAYARCPGCSLKELNLSGREELLYYIRINKGGKVVEFAATDGTFQYYYKGKELLIADIENVSDLSNTIARVISISNNKVARNIKEPPSTKKIIRGTSGEVTSNYLGTNLKRNEIEKISFVASTEGHTANGEDCFDLSNGSNGSVLGWKTDVDSNGLYELTIGSTEGAVFLTNGDYFFYNLNHLKEISGMQNLESVKMTSMWRMFGNCSSLTSLDLSNLDTSSVTSMGSTFDGLYSLTSLDLSPLDTSNVTYMDSLFHGCTKLTSLDLSPLNTSKVTNMAGMFTSCVSLQSVKFGNIDTSKVTTMSGMFFGCSNIKNIDFGNIDTTSLTDMRNMFVSDYNLEVVDLSVFDTSNVTDMTDMFTNDSKLRTVYVSNKFNTDKVSSSAQLFSSNTSLVGGSGTTFSSSHKTKEYARIDGGASNPGYFTRK